MIKLSLLTPEFMRDPYPTYKRMRNDFPLYYEESMRA